MKIFSQTIYKVSVFKLEFLTRCLLKELWVSCKVMNRIVYSISI